MTATKSRPPRADDRPAEAGLSRRSTWDLVASILVVAIVAGTMLVVAQSVIAAFSLPKLAVLSIGAVAVVVLWTLQGLVTRTWLIPATVLNWFLVAFVVGVTWAVVWSPGLERALFGQYRRNIGWIALVGAVVVAAAVARWLRDHRELWLPRTLIVVGGLTLAYATLQRLDRDPLGWELATSNVVFSWLGNVNFLSGFLGALVPLMVWGTITRTWPLALRVASALAAVGSVWILVGVRSFQGLPTALGGLLVFGVLWALSKPGWLAERWRRPAWRAGAIAIVVAGLLAVVAVGVYGVTSGRATGSGPQERLYMWSGAISATVAEPLTGNGVDNFVGTFPAHRGDHVREFRNSLVDNPHNVPLSMFSGGGVPLGLAYLALVGATAFVFVRGFRRTDDPTRRLLLAGLGGAWVGYQIQSMVSIDMLPLLTLHFALIGSIVAVAERPELLGVGRALIPGRNRIAARARRLPGWGRAAAGVVVLAAAGFAVVRLWLPVAADASAKLSNDALLAGDTASSVSLLADATSWAPFEPFYWALYGERLASSGQVALAMRALEESVERSAGNPIYSLAGAETAVRLGQINTAVRWAEETIRREPEQTTHNGTLALALAFAGRHDEALEVFERGHRRDAVRILLGVALYAAAGDVEAAGEQLALMRDRFEDRPLDGPLQALAPSDAEAARTYWGVLAELEPDEPYWREALASVGG